MFCLSVAIGATKHTKVWKCGVCGVVGIGVVAGDFAQIYIVFVAVFL
jgi:hypothetical protein